jgi:spermidine/putrescine transport system substrate-binding protein
MNKRQASIFILICTLLVACTQTTPRTSTPTPMTTLTLYSWVDYLPQSVIDAFTAETGVSIDYVVYESQEEAVANLMAGKPYDVVVLTIEFIPKLIQADLLAELDHRNIPNFNNISANFRDLNFDPGNRYAAPFHWGATGLLYRSDLVDPPPTRWADLWDPRFTGKVALWPIKMSLLPIALKKLGYSANSGDPAEVEAAVAELLKLTPDAIWISNLQASAAPTLTSGEALITYGWAYDGKFAEAEGLPITYVLPEEGSVLWMDQFIIPANSPKRVLAERFIDFMLRPEISAQIIAESAYPMANDAALPLLDPAIVNDPIIYPPPADLARAEITEPLDPARDRLWADAWRRIWPADP